MLAVHFVELGGGLVPIALVDLLPGIGIDLVDRPLLILRGVLVEVVAGVVAAEQAAAGQRQRGRARPSEKRGIFAGHTHYRSSIFAMRDKLLCHFLARPSMRQAAL